MKMKQVVLAAGCLAAVGVWASQQGTPADARAQSAEILGQMADGAIPASASAAHRSAVARERLQDSMEALNVGDTDSFGRNVKWLGYLSSGSVVLSENCESYLAANPGGKCLPVSSTGTGSVSGTLDNLSSMTLPGKSMNSLLCHWYSPTVSAVLYNNSGFDNRVGSLVVWPTLTFENPAFARADLVDPATGEPLNGRLTLSASSLRLNSVLDQGEQLPTSSNITRTCIGGYISRRALLETYALTEAEADLFFKSDTRITLGLFASASLVRSGNMVLSFRFVGD